MAATDRELWILNFYRNSELHGALLMGRLARTGSDTDVIVQATRHCATEAHHAALLSETIAALGGTIDPRIPTVQEHYSEKGGVPASLVDLLVLSEVLEQRVLATYRAHVAQPEVHPDVRRTLEDILIEMEQEDHGEKGSWIERALDRHAPDLVEAAGRKWRAVDQAVVGELERTVSSRFPDREPRA